MARIGFLSVAVFAVILAILTQQAFALKCWSCNNYDSKFCDDPFDSSKVNAAERLSLYDCPNGRCVKSIEKNTGSNAAEQPFIINRLCAQNQLLADAHCASKKFESCESCTSEECNAAITNGPIALMVAIPVVIAKIFLI